ncbi:hypothetical protein ACJX0J_017888 [Zea mays]
MEIQGQTNVSLWLGEDMLGAWWLTCVNSFAWEEIYLEVVHSGWNALKETAKRKNFVARLAACVDRFYTNLIGKCNDGAEMDNFMLASLLYNIEAAWFWSDLEGYYLCSMEDMVSFGEKPLIIFLWFAPSREVRVSNIWDHEDIPINLYRDTPKDKRKGLNTLIILLSPPNLDACHGKKYVMFLTFTPEQRHPCPVNIMSKATHKLWGFPKDR